MNLRAALLAMAAAGAFLLVAACGGDGAGSDTSRSQVGDATSSTDSSASSSPIASTGSTGNTGSTVGPGSNCGGSISGAGGDASCSSPDAPYVAIDLSTGGGSGIGSIPDHFVAVATSGGTQVGWLAHDDQWVHAAKWAGSASSVVDLHPSGFRESRALGISGDQIVGVGQGQILDGEDHALLWTGRGVVDLNPSGFRGSVAAATDGAQHVGYGIRTGSNDHHAILWIGSTNSVVDLHPVSGYSISFANGVNGGQQVGWGGAFGSSHALLWTGTAESVVDLHPSGFRESSAQAVAAGRQVGYGITADGSTHALLWNGTANSVVDLHTLLPAGFRHSLARGIDASGNIIGTAIDASGISRAISWVRQ